MTTYYLNEDKSYHPVETLEWAKQFEELANSGKRQVAEDVVNGCRVSTVWLGIDHSPLDGAEPLVFETMVFSNHDNGIEFYQDRYSTYLEALEGHQKAIEWVKLNYE